MQQQPTTTTTQPHQGGEGGGGGHVAGTASPTTPTITTTITPPTTRPAAVVNFQFPPSHSSAAPPPQPSPRPTTSSSTAALMSSPASSSSSSSAAAASASASSDSSAASSSSSVGTSFYFSASSSSSPSSSAAAASPSFSSTAPALRLDATTTVPPQQPQPQPQPRAQHPLPTFLPPPPSASSSSAVSSSSSIASPFWKGASSTFQSLSSSSPSSLPSSSSSSALATAASPSPSPSPSLSPSAAQQQQQQQRKRKRATAQDDVLGAENFRRWLPQDDILLKDSVQGAVSFEKIAETVRFSQKFSAAQIQERWLALLYDPDTASKAAQEMAKQPSVNRRVLWSEIEESVLRNEVHGIHFSSFQKVLERNRPMFHSSRTAKSLEAHYYRMKRHGTLETGDPTQNAAKQQSTSAVFNVDFSEMEEELLNKAPTTSNATDQISLKQRKKEYDKAMKWVQLNTLKYEEEMAKEKIRSNKVLAVFRGKSLRYEMQSKEVLIGRATKDNIVDVDVSLEGNATKISRQQATIKLKRDGNFYIRNIGRRPLFVNGKPLAIGQKMRLSDNSLIEMHALGFIFEINKVLWTKIKRVLSSSS